MCVPACYQKIVQSINRRDFLQTTCTAAAVAVSSFVSAITPVPTSAAPTTITFTRVVDLTHTMTPDFPTFGGAKQLELETLVTLQKDGYNMYKWLLNEHTGTHMDAPFHFSDKDTADKIPVSNLVGPLAVVDIRAKATQNADAQLTLEDLQGWENQNGSIPEGGVVAMLSGWDAFVKTAKFRNADDQKVMHFPGFHIEAIAFLLAERNVKGICVDTLSLDYGRSTDFAVHYKWLPANRWGMECVANLAALPAKGATIVVGGPKIGGATGGPSRVLAFV
jgi:kynurenine formamidase